MKNLKKLLGWQHLFFTYFTFIFIFFNIFILCEIHSVWEIRQLRKLKANEKLFLIAFKRFPKAFLLINFSLWFKLPFQFKNNILVFSVSISFSVFFSLNIKYCTKKHSFNFYLQNFSKTWRTRSFLFSN